VRAKHINLKLKQHINLNLFACSSVSKAHQPEPEAANHPEAAASFLALSQCSGFA
jgi:hypothetical protein